jgi:hypothetical protein
MICSRGSFAPDSPLASDVPVGTDSDVPGSVPGIYT